MRIEDQTPEHRAAVIERRRERDRAKSRKRKEQRRAAKIAASPLQAVSKTDPVTRRRLHGPAPEMTKNEMRADLARAVRNTAGMAI
jgi:hypothetical protein